MENSYFGKLYPFSETGTEGIIWCVLKDVADEASPYDKLHMLEPGDDLEVYDDNTNLFWKGTFKPNYQKNRRPCPFNPINSAQAIQGLWVRGVQEDCIPEFWLTMFLREMRVKVCTDQ